MTLFLVACLPHQLRVDLVPDAVHAYRLERTYVAINAEESLTWTEDLEFILGPKSDPGKIMVRRRTLSTEIDGHTFAAPQQSPWLAIPSRLDLLGRWSLRPIPSGDGIVFANQMRAIEWPLPDTPISTGAAWQREEAADPASGLPAAHWDFIASMVNEGEIVLTSHYVAGEGELSASGTVTLDAKSGWPIRVETEIEPTVLPGDEERIPQRLRIRMTRR